MLSFQLRRKSKAQEAGLREADLLLTINGYSCRDMSHATAMTLVDTSGHTLTMTVLRSVCLSGLSVCLSVCLSATVREKSCEKVAAHEVPIKKLPVNKQD